MPTYSPVPTQDVAPPSDFDLYAASFKEAMDDHAGYGRFTLGAGEGAQSVRWCASRSASLLGLRLRWLRWRETDGVLVFKVERNGGPQ